MNKSGYVLFGLIVLVVIIQNASTQRTEYPCKTSCECRTNYCRGGKCIQYGQIPDERDENGNSQVSPCNYAKCPSGSSCYIQEVQCVKAPCPGVATCIKDLNTCT
ncbi:uncharacterized protein LOC122854479 isoform X3 [Aphidius gifuensis]|uniref:uncharacterized protein LOC122854479 isoform X3 n=1 Tax=Aphidius gifuensis TaxID=684658 RepID=UPI001CDB5B33|nr:uncharacterized protein LOC122854479 isoform X3 [Aphidius gifuensis]